MTLSPPGGHGDSSPRRKNLVGVSFKSNLSLSERYSSYLSSSHLTDKTDMFLAADNFVLVSTAGTVLQPRLIREDDTVPAVSHMHSFAHKCRRGGRFYKSSDIIAIDFTTLMRKTTPPPTCTQLLLRVILIN